MKLLAFSSKHKPKQNRYQCRRPSLSTKLIYSKDEVETSIPIVTGTTKKEAEDEVKLQSFRKKLFPIGEFDSKIAAI